MSFSKAKRFSYSPDFPERTSRGSNGGEKSNCSNSTKQNLNRTFTKHSPCASTPLASPTQHDKTVIRNNLKAKERAAHEDTFEKFREDFNGKNLPRTQKVEPFHLNNDTGNPEENLGDIRLTEPAKIRGGKSLESATAGTEENVNESISKAIKKVVTGNENRIREAMKSITDFNLEVISDLSRELTSRIGATVNGSREEDFRRLISLLLRQIEDGKYYTRFLERNYVRILTAAYKEIEEKTAIIEALRAEIDAMEMNRKIKNIWRK